MSSHILLGDLPGFPSLVEHLLDLVSPQVADDEENNEGQDEEEEDEKTSHGFGGHTCRQADGESRKRCQEGLLVTTKVKGS